MPEPSIGPYNSDLAFRAAQEIFNVNHFPSRGDDIVVSSSGKLFVKALYSLCEDAGNAVGIDWKGISPVEQRRLALDFLSAFTVRARREQELEVQTQISESDLSPINIFLSPSKITLQVENGARSGSKETFTDGSKIMLAYFAGLTLAKIQRCHSAWVTRSEVADLSHTSKDRVGDNMFDKLFMLGLVERNLGHGYRLVYDPEQLINILENRQYTNFIVQPVSFAEWYEAKQGNLLLLEDNQIPVIRALRSNWDRIKQTAGTRHHPIITSEFAAEVKLSESALLAQLRRLDEAHGLIRRGSERFFYDDIIEAVFDYISKVVDIPIAVIVEFAARETGSTQETITVETQGVEKRAEIQEEDNFPVVLWTVDAAKAHKFIDDTREARIGALRQLFQLRLNNGVMDRIEKDGCTGLVPSSDELDVAADPEVNLDDVRVKEVLNYLGLGPVELVQILRISNVRKHPDTTLAVVLGRFEERQAKSEKDYSLIAEVKKRLRRIIFDVTFDADQTSAGTLRDLFAQLFSEQGNVQLPETLERGESVVDEGLLSELQPRLLREIAAAISQPSLQNGFLVPIAAFNYHRVLSDKADQMPWQQLYNFGFAKKEGHDGHPTINAAGALLSACFQDRNVKDRLASITRGNCQKQLVRLAVHSVHLIRGYLAENIKLGEESKEVRYARHILESLQKVKLDCTCEKCAGTR
jgi:hypothetical protein